MKLVNRSAIALVPTAIMLEWINRVDPEHKISLVEAQEDPALYLVSDIESPDEMDEFLEDNYHQMLQSAFHEWYTDADIWPPLTLHTLQQYFTAKLFTMLADIDDDMPLERDAMHDDSEDEDDSDESNEPN